VPPAVCDGCGRSYPIVADVPVLLRDPAVAESTHDADLPFREGYGLWKERLILKALTDAHVVLDFGAGRQGFDDPCIIKLDIVHDRGLDVAGDLCELPFPSESFDFVFGGAVMEHVRDPARAIAELHRVLRPGGYIYADWAFMTAYHGYPDHYTNATVHGIAEWFRAFTCLESGVGPHLAPSFALRSLLSTYVAHFRPGTTLEREYLELLHRVLWYPLHEMDQCLPRDDWFRTAAGVYFFGVKQPAGHESVLPPPVLAAHARRADLQARYPSPLNIATPDNLMEWAHTEGRATDPEIRRWFDEQTPFSKTARQAPPRVVREWPSELLTRPMYEDTHEGPRKMALWHSRPLGARLRDSWDEAGLWGFTRGVWRSIPPWWKRPLRALRASVRRASS
jgi:SAM-dependent methyltransferase